MDTQNDQISIGDLSGPRQATVKAYTASPWLSMGWTGMGRDGQGWAGKGRDRQGSARMDLDLFQP
jgi:hypothetical protein